FVLPFSGGLVLACLKPAYTNHYFLNFIRIFAFTEIIEGSSHKIIVKTFNQAVDCASRCCTLLDL
ncbi:MAG: hypothetical protein V3V90_05355, partial [Thermodesulfobacteriota bacterium]